MPGTCRRTQPLTLARQKERSASASPAPEVRRAARQKAKQPAHCGSTPAETDVDNGNVMDEHIDTSNLTFYLFIVRL